MVVPPLLFNTFHLGLSYCHLFAVHESEKEAKTFLSFINIQALWLEELIFLLSIFHSHYIDGLIQLICQQLIE